jgi:hypothetical protein
MINSTNRFEDDDFDDGGFSMFNDAEFKAMHPLEYRSEGADALILKDGVEIYRCPIVDVKALYNAREIVNTIIMEQLTVVEMKNLRDIIDMFIRSTM